MILVITRIHRCSTASLRSLGTDCSGMDTSVVHSFGGMVVGQADVASVTRLRQEGRACLQTLRAASPHAGSS